jgi:hypothetical protein
VEFYACWETSTKTKFLQTQKTKGLQNVGLQSPANAKKYEGKKTEFSGFTKGSDSLAGGYFSGNAIMYELQADVLFGMPKDFFSDVDRNGYKWLSNDSFGTYIQKKMEEYYKKHEPDPLGSSNYEIDYRMATYLEGDGKRKRDFIKWYYVQAQIFLRNPKNVEKVIKQETHLNDYKHDEVVFNNYKIIGAYVIGPKLLQSSKRFALDAVEYNITSIIDAYKNIKKAKIKYLGTILEVEIKKINLEKGKEAKDLAFFPPYDKIEKWIYQQEG